MLVNGLYTIVLQATDHSSQTANDSISVLVDGNLKVGNFSFTVVDMEIPVSSIPIRVTSTHDSRRKGRLKEVSILEFSSAHLYVKQSIE